MDGQTQDWGMIPMCHEAYASDTKINNLFWLKLASIFTELYQPQADTKTKMAEWCKITRHLSCCDR